MSSSPVPFSAKPGNWGYEYERSSDQDGTTTLRSCDRIATANKITQDSIKVRNRLCQNNAVASHLSSKLGMVHVATMNVWRKATRLWEAAQVSHHGAYSLARFFGLREYSRKTPWYRVVLVLILVITPPLGMISLIDSIPLQDPAAGWQTNWVFWCRCGLSVFALTFASALQFHVTAPDAKLNLTKCVEIALVVSVGYPISMLGVACLWGFPIPFQLITCTGAWHFWFVISMIFTLGWKNIALNAELRRQAKRYIDIVQIQAPLLLFYPAYSAIFMRLSLQHQTLFIFVLPVVKIMLKNALAKRCAGLGDIIPTIVISVDLFNAMYQSKSLQSSGSLWTALGIVLIDVIQNMMAMWRLHRLVRGLYALQSAAGDNKQTLDLLATIAEGCSNPESLEEEYWLSLQPLQVNPSTSTEKQIPPRRYPIKHRIIPLNEHAQVHPDSDAKAETQERDTPCSIAGPSLSLIPPTSATHDENLRKTRTLLHRKALQLLHRTEFILLVEYVECAIPFLYVIYMPILLQFENRKYYPDFKDMTDSKLKHVIRTVLIYALLELGSLIYFQWKIQSRFQISALHQLAFILERDFLVIQAGFMAWTLIIFQFSVVHFGTFC